MAAGIKRSIQFSAANWARLQELHLKWNRANMNQTINLLVEKSFEIDIYKEPADFFRAWLKVLQAQK